MIEVKKIKPKAVSVYNPDGSLLAICENVYEFNHIRIQIANLKLEGYTYTFGYDVEEEVEIDSNGKPKLWFRGMFDIEEIQLSHLFMIQNNKGDFEKYLEDMKPYFV